jgi:hypothetical protein
MSKDFDTEPVLPPPPPLPQMSLPMDSLDKSEVSEVENLEGGVSNSNNDVEFMAGTDSQTLTGAMFDGVLSVLWLIIVIILTASVFIIAPEFRIFWLVVISLLILMTLGFRVYSEWMNRAQLEDSQNHKEWSMGLLYLLVIVYTLTMLAVMFVLLWKIVATVNARTNLIKERPKPILKPRYENEY